MKINRRLSIVLCAALLASASAAMADFASDREATMKDVGGAMKELAAITKGAPFDAATVGTLAARMDADFDKFGTLFPAGSETASKAASPDIWTNRADFDTLRANARAAAAKVGASDEAGFKTAFGELAGACKACHTKYRISD